MEGNNLLRGLEGRLATAESAALGTAVNIATAYDAALFLVGGSVRDLVLGRPSVDIDVAVEGDVAAISDRLALATGFRVVQHGRFGTATLRGPDFEIDFARARRETYARPGALPEVAPAGITEDLARRDFTINALAIRLTRPRGELLDPHGGGDDLAGRAVRVLHERSFQDDATRMLRACRYAARLTFRIEAGTLSLLRRDLPFVDSITGPRLRRELTLLFREATAAEGALVASRLDLLPALHPLLGIGEALGRAWADALAAERFAPLDELGWCLVSRCQTGDDVSTLSKRLHLTGRIETALLDLVRLAAGFDKLDRTLIETVDVVDMLAGLTPAAVWAFGLKAGGLVRQRCENFLRDWRKVRPALNGFDLQALGLNGPAVGRAQERLRRARLGGEVRTRDEEVGLVRRELTTFGGTA